MGLLDDAIREHLELKRLHGADVREVERLEREALGPIKRAPEPGEEPVAEPVAATPAPEPAEPAVPEPPAAEPEVAVPPPPAAEPEPSPPDADPDSPALAETTVQHAAARPHRPQPEPWLDEPDEVTEEERLDHRHRRTPPAREPDYVVPDEEPGAEDVLEETPDFLQETPEHDRLWFEQKPPKDFDFGA